MSKFFNNIFGNKATTNSSTSGTPTAKMKQRKLTNGRLETDALPVDDDDSTNANLSVSTTPTVSAEMSADAVRELSDPNYNSSSAMMEFSTRNEAAAMAVGVANSEDVVPGTTNTMNVHNAQQQLVMQFSNANNVHFGSVYNFNSNTSNNSAGGIDSRKSSCCADDAGVIGLETKRLPGTTTKKTTSIVAMMQSQEEPNHRMLDTISTHLGEGWKDVMRNLGHSEGQVAQALIDHQMHGGIKEVIYQLLLQWIRNAEDGEATVGRITSLLWEMKHKECVQRMKLVWKSNPLRKSSTR